MENKINIYVYIAQLFCSMFIWLKIITKAVYYQVPTLRTVWRVHGLEKMGWKQICSVYRENEYFDQILTTQEN